MISEKLLTQREIVKNKALQDLRSFVKQGIIERRERGSHLIFVRPATQTEDEN